MIRSLDFFFFKSRFRDQIKQMKNGQIQLLDSERHLNYSWDWNTDL